MEEIAESEISQFHYSQFLEKDNVFWFQIPVNHVQLMAIVYCLQNLESEKGKGASGELDPSEQRAVRDNSVLPSQST